MAGYDTYWDRYNLGMKIRSQHKFTYYNGWAAPLSADGSVSEHATGFHCACVANMKVSSGLKSLQTLKSRGS